MKILVLGATGMLGSAVYIVLTRSEGFVVEGTVRSLDAIGLFPAECALGLVNVADLEDLAELSQLLDRSAPDAVVNCLSACKPLSTDPMKTISMFGLLPRRLSMLCGQRGIRLVQISTDGVFSGELGRYCEADLPDANDVYGVAKLLGEPPEANAITLRTSIVGPELRGGSGLLEWFLSQDGSCIGYRRVIFSGLPTNVLAEIIRDAVLPSPQLHGIYHVAARDFEVRSAKSDRPALWQANSACCQREPGLRSLTGR